MIRLSSLRNTLGVFIVLPFLWCAERFIASGERFWQWRWEGMTVAIVTGVVLSLLFFIPIWRGALWMREWFGIVTRIWGVFLLLIAWMNGSSAEALMGVVWLAFSGLGFFMIRKETEVTFIDPQVPWYVGKLRARVGVTASIHEKSKSIPVSVVRFDETGLMFAGAPDGLKLGQKIKLSIQTMGHQAEFVGRVVRQIGRLKAVGLRSEFDHADQYKSYLDCVERLRAHG